MLYGTEPVSPWVGRFAALVPDGEVLDLACGRGRHARLFAAAGYPVLALDRDADALASLTADGIPTQLFDLENGTPWPFGPERFAGIVVTNYLYRPLFPSLLQSLAPGGVLLMETFGQGHGQFGKPSNPDYLLAPGELLGLASSTPIHVLAYEDGYVETPRPAMVQRICLIKPPLPADALRRRLI